MVCWLFLKSLNWSTKVLLELREWFAFYFLETIPEMLLLTLPLYLSALWWPYYMPGIRDSMRVVGDPIDNYSGMSSLSSRGPKVFYCVYCVVKFFLYQIDQSDFPAVLLEWSAFIFIEVVLLGSIAFIPCLDLGRRILADFEGEALELDLFLIFRLEWFSSRFE